MAEDGDGDMTGQDPLSSAAQGDADPGSAALAEAGTGAGADDERVAERAHDGADERADVAVAGPPPEAYDDTPVTDAPPESNLGFPER